MGAGPFSVEVDVEIEKELSPEEIRRRERRETRKREKELAKRGLIDVGTELNFFLLETGGAW